MPQLVTNEQNQQMFPKELAEQMNKLPLGTSRANSLWEGPSSGKPNGGITQSGLQKYLCCRERFRVQYVLGLHPLDRWTKPLGFGNMWHACEEALARGSGVTWGEALDAHTSEQMGAYPLQREEIARWYGVCRALFPEYVDHWAAHPDVLDRQPLVQEQVFNVPYQLPSGRVVRLRGKFDSVDLIPSQGGVFLQENKTKSKIDPVALQRQMRFDLQTMVYLIALQKTLDAGISSGNKAVVCGVRYNVVRRDCPIRPHAEKVKRGKRGRKTLPDEPDTVTPAETEEHFLERLRDDYVRANPEEWFYRLMCRTSAADLVAFRRRCLDPVLENLSDDFAWWEWCLKKGADCWDGELRQVVFPIHTQRHYQFPFGVYNALVETGCTDYDEFLATGSEAGLRYAQNLFHELN